MKDEHNHHYYRQYLETLCQQNELVPAIKAYIQHCRKSIYDLMKQKWPAHRQVTLMSSMIDQLICYLYEHAKEKLQMNHSLGVAVFAQGGYGRSELNLYSDIDLLFLFEPKQEEQIKKFSSEILYPLWDAGLTVGHATRNMSDSQHIIKSDVRAFSSMVDARYLCGQQELADHFLLFLKNIFKSTRVANRFILGKVQEKEDRIGKFGNLVYLSEPNIKESEGGLRDWHLLRYLLLAKLGTDNPDVWIESEYLTHEEWDTVQRSLDFLWLTRNYLHYHQNKCSDKLMFQMQEVIALDMGFVKTDATHSVEKFMQQYYYHAANLNKISQEVIRRVEGEKRSFTKKLRALFRPHIDENFVEDRNMILASDVHALKINPIAIVKAFYHSQHLSTPLDPALLYWIRSHQNLLNREEMRTHPEVQKTLRDIFNQLQGLGDILLLMHENGVLPALLPEFAQIYFQPQYDVYHFYTVDTHLILAVQELSKLFMGKYDEEFPQYKKILDEITRHDLLALGVLFHDIGKGKGGNHSVKGADIARVAMMRMAYPEADIQIVDFLVRSHLIMSHISQRRDLEDTSMIENLASSIMTTERLNLLYLLTWADIRAVSPECWTAWKGSLLENLYFKCRAALEEGEKAQENFKQIANQRKQEVVDYCQSNNLKNEMQFFQTLPRRYFMVHKPSTIRMHLDLINQCKANSFSMKTIQDETQMNTRLFIFTHGSYEMLPRLTGVLASCGINIMSLIQYYSSSGGVLLLMRVTDSRGLLVNNERTWQRFQERFDDVIKGRVQASELFEQFKLNSVFPPKVVRQSPPKVKFDNDVSAYYTVIEVFANDRVGLLYEIVSTLEKHGVYIDISKIGTEVDQVADIFYVRDVYGNKITNTPRLNEIKNALLELVNHSMAA